MAKQFGGKYSPDGASDQGPREVIDDRQVDAAGARSNLLFVPAIVLVATTFSDGPVALIAGLIGAEALVDEAMPGKTGASNQNLAGTIGGGDVAARRAARRGGL